MLLALAGVSSVAMAQQKTEVVEEFGVIQVQDKYQVITNPFWSNWFFSIGGGAEATFGDNDSAGSFGKRISPTLNISVGKWFTPGLGLRLQPYSEHYFFLLSLIWQVLLMQPLPLCL